MLWSALKTNQPHWLEQNKTRVLLQIGLVRHKDLLQVPLMTDLAQNEAERKIYELYTSPVLVGRPLMAPPGVPKERVDALRGAFDAAVKDPAYLVDAQKMNLEIAPVSGAVLQQAVGELLSLPDEVVELARSAQAKGATFSCAEVVQNRNLCSPLKP